MPWLTDEDIRVALGGKRISKKSCKASLEEAGSDVDAEEEVDHVDEDLGEADEDTYVHGLAGPELEALRDEAGVEFDPEEAFRWRIIGGAFVSRHWQVANRCKAFATWAWIESWCENYMWPKERNFAFAKFTYEGSCRLAAEFCRRSNHFYNVWWLGDELLHTYTELDCAKDSEEFTVFLSSFEEDHPVFEAFESMKALMPVIKT